jgi:hypothetical protein
MEKSIYGPKQTKLYYESKRLKMKTAWKCFGESLPDRISTKICETVFGNQ